MIVPTGQTATAHTKAGRFWYSPSPCEVIFDTSAALQGCDGQGMFCHGRAARSGYWRSASPCTGETSGRLFRTKGAGMCDEGDVLPPCGYYMLWGPARVVATLNGRPQMDTHALHAGGPAVCGRLAPQPVLHLLRARLATTSRAGRSRHPTARGRRGDADRLSLHTRFTHLIGSLDGKGDKVYDQVYDEV
jgi:hypothetical protein